MRSLPLMILIVGCQPRTALLEPSPQPRPVQRVQLTPAGLAALPSNTGHLALGDVDGDFHADVVYTVDANRIHWGRSDERGELRTSSLLTHDALRTTITRGLGVPDHGEVQILDLELADMDLDGGMDLALRVRLTSDDGVTDAAGVLYAPDRFPVFLPVIDTNASPSTVVADLDGDGLPEWLHTGPNAAVHTSSGAIWPLGDAASWVQYPHAVTFDTPDGPMLSLFVNGGYGISEVHTWRPTAAGLTAVSDPQELYAEAVTFSRAPHQASTQALLTGTGHLMSFDGTSWDNAAPLSSTFWQRPIAIGDLTGDGVLDTLVNSEDSAPVLLAGTDTGTLVDFPLDGLDSLTRTAWIADVTGDGLGDVVTVERGDEGAALRVWVNSGE